MGFRVWGLELWVWGLRLSGPEFGIWVVVFWIWG